MDIIDSDGNTVQTISMVQTTKIRSEYVIHLNLQIEIASVPIRDLFFVVLQFQLLSCSSNHISSSSKFLFRFVLRLSATKQREV